MSTNRHLLSDKKRTRTMSCSFLVETAGLELRSTSSLAFPFFTLTFYASFASLRSLYVPHGSAKAYRREMDDGSSPKRTLHQKKNTNDVVFFFWWRLLDLSSALRVRLLFLSLLSHFMHLSQASAHYMSLTAPPKRTAVRWTTVQVRNALSTKKRTRTMSCSFFGGDCWT